MLPAFLVEETTVTADGEGPPIELGDAAGGMILFTLGIVNVVEQESLDVEIEGSKDGETWEGPIRKFPQKFYRGLYSILCDLSEHREVRQIRARWKVNRWGVGSTTPMFRFWAAAELFEEPLSRTA